MAVGSRVLLVATSWAVLLHQASALFEDEVGQYEWLYQQIGKPTALACSKQAPDRVFVASGSGVVASVAVKDGKIEWRREAVPQGSVQIMRTDGRGLFSVTDRGLVQAWKSSSGDLTWQRDYQKMVLDLLLAGPSSRQLIVVLRELEVEARTLAGKHEWSLPSGEVGANARFWVASPAEKDETVCVLASQADGSDAVALHLELTGGKVLKKVDIPSEVAISLKSGSYLAVNTHLVLLTNDALLSVPLCGGSLADPFELKKVKWEGTDTFRFLHWQGTPGVFAVTDGATTAIFGIGPKGLKHLRTFGGVALVGPVFSVHDDETAQPVAVAVVKQKGTQIQLLDPASGNVQPAIHAQGYISSDHGDARLLIVQELSSGEHRTILSATDHSFAGIQGTKVIWVREEALASIRQAVFYTRSSAALRAEGASLQESPKGIQALGEEFTNLVIRLAKEPFEIASALAKWLTPVRRKRTSMNLLPGSSVPSSSEELRDFGASKLILAVTRAGKLFALEATTSEVVWQKYLGGGSQSTDNGVDCARAAHWNSTEMATCGPWMELLPSPSAAHSELLVVVPASGRGATAAEILWVDPLTGNTTLKEAVPGNGQVLSIVPLPKRGKHVLFKSPMPFLLIDTNKTIYPMPAAAVEASKFLEEEAAEKLFHFEVDGAAQVVQGYAAIGAKGRELVRLWNLELGTIGQRILTAAAPDHRAYHHVPVHIKGDSSILYKYINPNLLAVVTEEDTKGNSSALNVYALDTVTGHIVQQSHIKGGAGPVHLAVCDNWIIVHYRNPKKTRFELLVMEFFQAKADDGPWDILFGSRQAQGQWKSAHHLETPVPLQQTYIFPSGVTAMGVTATLKGITPRSIIMALSTEHIFRVSKDMLNPRRPYPGEKEKSIPAQFAPTKEEVLPPYAPTIPMKHTDTMTHYNSMGQVAGIVSAPIALESTSLVFCFGLDLFFAPVQTAKAYDVLSPGFNYVLLFCSVGLVFTVFIATSFLAHRKTLQDKWR